MPVERNREHQSLGRRFVNGLGRFGRGLINAAAPGRPFDNHQQGWGNAWRYGDYQALRGGVTGNPEYDAYRRNVAIGRIGGDLVGAPGILQNIAQGVYSNNANPYDPDNYNFMGPPRERDQARRERSARGRKDPDGFHSVGGGLLEANTPSGSGYDFVYEDPASVGPPAPESAPQGRSGGASASSSGPSRAGGIHGALVDSYNRGGIGAALASRIGGMQMTDTAANRRNKNSNKQKEDKV